MIDMDFRVELSQEPIPTALWLFEFAIVSFLGGLRRQSK